MTVARTAEMKVQKWDRKLVVMLVVKKVVTMASKMAGLLVGSKAVL